MDARFAGKVAVVTAGAGAGIGGSITRRLHHDGATVVVSDASASRVAKMSAELGIVGEVVDVADAAVLQAHLDGVIERHGRIDILVNVAGANVVKVPWEITDVEWRHVFEVNIHAPFRAARAVLPGMIERGTGAIVNIASIAAWDPAPEEAAYSTTKAALVALTRALSVQVAASGVRVNAVAPSFVDSPFMAKVYGPERLAALRAATPRQRGVLPEEVAAAVVWLASAEAEYVSGETITIAGGSFHRAG